QVPGARCQVPGETRVPGARCQVPGDEGRGTRPRAPSPAPGTRHPAPASAPLPAELTAREREVLRLVADGLTNAEVAERLVVSPRTVSTHLTAIYGKLGVRSRSAAVRFALDHGLR